MFAVHDRAYKNCVLISSLCTGANISAERLLCQTVYKIQIRTNPQCLMSAIVTLNLLFVKAIPCKSVQYWVLMPKLHASFWESSLYMFLFWLQQGSFRTVSKISAMPELKENYAQGTASTSFTDLLYYCDCMNTQQFDGTRLAPGGRSSHSPTTIVNIPKPLKYWVGVQQGQSYLMGRRCLFSLGWQPF